MPKKRKSKRLNVADYFKKNRKYFKQFFAIFDRADNRLVGHLMDISPEGMMMISREEVKKGVTQKLRIALPEKINGSGWLTIDARGVWAKKQEEPECYYTGFEFVTISSIHTEIIKNMIAKFTTDNVPQAEVLSAE